jgi:tRNA uridine 5-carbamoylmethylation protein Kti12
MTDDISILFKNTGFRTDLWYYCVRNKINHLINVLKNYKCLNNIKYFIFTDCDIIYIKKNINEWYNLEKYIQNENKDIHFMRENSSDDVNSGFFIIKNNDNITNIIQFFIKVLQTIDTTEKVKMPLGDQSIINNLKNKINYGFIPNDYVIFGSIIFNINKSLFHHAVGCIDVDDKIKQINQIKREFQ